MARLFLFFSFLLCVLINFLNKQARLNNNNPLTDGERVAGFINAQKALKVLTCSLCKKGFRSGLGYKFHYDICGKDVSFFIRVFLQSNNLFF